MIYWRDSLRDLVTARFWPVAVTVFLTALVLGSRLVPLTLVDTDCAKIIGYFISYVESYVFCELRCYWDSEAYYYY